MPTDEKARVEATCRVVGKPREKSREDKERKHQNEVIEFTVRCRMKRRWATQFLAMLEYMSLLGGLGSSREVGLYADGDGDFRPRFTYDPTLCPEPSVVVPVRERGGDRLYDAG